MTASRVPAGFSSKKLLVVLRTPSLPTVRLRDHSARPLSTSYADNGMLV